MKKSRIICSIVTVTYILFSIALLVMLGIDTVKIKSDIRVYIKFGYVIFIVVSIIMYFLLKNKLEKKIANAKLIQAYKYLYIAVAIFVTRLVLVYLYKNVSVEVVVPSFKNGLGSYLNYGLYKVIGNQMYANVMINTIIAFVSAVLIKQVMLNITESDAMATICAIVVAFIPQSLFFMGNYVRYGYNLICVFAGLLVLLKIIDETRQYKIKNNKYVVLSVILGTVASIDIVLGGTLIFWLVVLVTLTLAMTYVDYIHLNVRGIFKNITNYKLKRIIEKIENTKVSKLVVTTIIVVVMCAIVTLVVSFINGVNNYEYLTGFSNLNRKLTAFFAHSRRWYIAMIIILVSFEFLSVCLKRKQEVKSLLVKVCYLVELVILPFSVTNCYTAYIFDILIAMLVITNICNIYFNREEKIKLIKEKN